VELSDYRPSLGGLPGLGYLYDLVQARTHSLHSQRFLRWLAANWRKLTTDD
jgi:hypothetical protein